MIAICAHRGGALLWPENSMRAFREAARLPIEEIECDVHLSADGVAVIHHDATLDRMTEATGPIAERSAAELAAIRIRGLDEGIPPLADLLALVAQTGKLLRLELKPDHRNRFNPALVAAVMSDLARIPARVRLMSFMPAALIAAPWPEKDWLISPAVMGWHSAESLNAGAAALGCSGIGFGYEPEYLPRVLDRITGVTNIWRADEEEALRAAFALAPSSITTDDPLLALRLREELSAPHA
ncbi:MAG: glycerophosphodiester phosphodiesterase family protein [Rhodovarius sp.]|nr:hypothetical protein [Rhodovarius sp.]MCX7932385.1 glycerophosphodiester phosphodiesterase family protein [Rhodovarius sp.]MDW8314128.1 glycerophosphodiester phosphodiesterase family protein [Rhodovarius sp.]